MGRTDQTIRETHIIAPECRERFIPMGSHAILPLRARDVSLAGMSRLRGVYQIGRVAAPYHVVLATLSGSGQLATTQQRIALKSGSVLVLPAHSSYQYRLVGREWNMMWFHLRASTVTWRAFLGQECSIVQGMNLSSLGQTMEGLFRELSGFQNDASGRTEGQIATRQTIGVYDVTAVEAAHAATLYAELAGIWLERLLRPHLPDKGAASKTRDLDLRQKLEGVFAEVDSALHQEWSVARLARLAHMSSGHLHRTVLRLFGKGPMEYVIGLRMRRAEALLMHSDLPVYEIAEIVGYTNSFAFSSAFRRHTGKTPSNSRRRPSEES